MEGTYLPAYDCTSGCGPEQHVSGISPGCETHTVVSNVSGTTRQGHLHPWVGDNVVSEQEERACVLGAPTPGQTRCVQVAGHD